MQYELSGLLRYPSWPSTRVTIWRRRMGERWERSPITPGSRLPAERPRGRETRPPITSARMAIAIATAAPPQRRPASPRRRAAADRRRGTRTVRRAAGSGCVQHLTAAPPQAHRRGLVPDAPPSDPPGGHASPAVGHGSDLSYYAGEQVGVRGTEPDRPGAGRAYAGGELDEGEGRSVRILDDLEPVDRPGCRSRPSGRSHRARRQGDRRVDVVAREVGHPVRADLGEGSRAPCPYIPPTSWSPSIHWVYGMPPKSSVLPLHPKRSP